MLDYVDSNEQMQLSHILRKGSGELPPVAGSYVRIDADRGRSPDSASFL